MKDLQQQLIIIPDVHGRDFWRDAVRMNPEARFVFLGDYLDPYPWEGVTVGKAFRGLQDIVAFKEAHPDRVTLLWGNHDLHYLYPDLGGCRYDYVNGDRNARFFDAHKALFGIAWETEAAGKRFLFSHAGVGLQWLRRNWPGLQPDEISAELFNDLVGYPSFMSALGDVSFYRGGLDSYGSMVWADENEQLDPLNRIPGIVQVFGHTLMDAPVCIGDGASFCLDCRRAFVLDPADGRIRDLVTGDIVG